ncbi:MAG: LysR substrate-binding domain-containing protein [Rickettsiella sp.]|nr:LysR substrate-binding domain-containing protein [Rickettsiella sp.]
MNLRDLKYLIALADYRHFGKAAKACFVSQPTLSIQLNKLEEELGVILFERGQKRVILTSMGRLIVNQAKVVLAASSKLKQLAKSADDPFSVQLRLGLIPTLGPYLLPVILPIIKKALPKLALFLYEDKTDNLVEQLKEGKLDAIILALPIMEHGLLIKPLFKEPFFLVLPSNHLLKHEKKVKLNDLNLDNLLLLEEGHCLREQALEICHRKSALKEKTNYRATSLETLRHMVACGIGITLLPLLALEERRLIVNKALASPVPQRTIGMLWRKDAALSICCEKLVEIITINVPPILAGLEKQL